jgi:hypothetical protein
MRRATDHSKGNCKTKPFNRKGRYGRKRKKQATAEAKPKAKATPFNH